MFNFPNSRSLMQKKDHNYVLHSTHNMHTQHNWQILSSFHWAPYQMHQPLFWKHSHTDTHTSLVKSTVWTCESTGIYHWGAFSTHTACHRNLAYCYRHSTDKHGWNILQSFSWLQKVASLLQISTTATVCVHSQELFYFTVYKYLTVAKPRLTLL